VSYATHSFDAVRLLRDGVTIATGRAAIEEAARQLLGGAVVAIPTDTVYGLAAAIDSPSALAAIFAIKGRERAQTLPVLVTDPAAASLLLRPTSLERGTASDRLLALADRFWPGGLTVALPARPDLPADVVAADGTVGVRVPDHDVARALLRLAGGALAVTSANRSGQPPLIDAAAVQRELGEKGLLWVLDGGPSGLVIASTVIGQANGKLVIHREGAIAGDILGQCWAALNAAAGQRPG